MTNDGNDDDDGDDDDDNDDNDDDNYYAAAGLDGTDGSRDASPQPRPHSRKRKRKAKTMTRRTSGRPKNGQEYWAAVEKWFAAKSRDWGKGWDKPRWTE
jgi:hypothetical protein